MTASTDALAPSLGGALRALTILLLATGAAVAYEHVTFTREARRIGSPG